MASKRPALRDLILMALLGALIYACKMVMAGLPNVEPVTLLVLVCSAVFGRSALWAVALYVGLETVTFGVNVWTVNYMYVWPLLWLLAQVFRKMEQPLGWALLAGAYGLFFGALCAPAYAVLYDWAYALSWWISGIPFDLIHAAGNFAIVLVLFKPLRDMLQRLKNGILKN